MAASGECSMSKLAAVSALAACLLTAAPSSTAAMHGVDWSASGVAVGGGSAQVITVAWNGCLGCSSGTFTVDTLNPLTGATTHTVFSGTESFNERNGLNNYVAFILMTGTSTNPSVSFTITAAQQVGTSIVFPGPKVLSQAMVGSFQGSTFAVATPLEFYQTG
jgi:hypothetical protein